MMEPKSYMDNPVPNDPPAPKPVKVEVEDDPEKQNLLGQVSRGIQNIRNRPRRSLSPQEERIRKWACISFAVVVVIIAIAVLVSSLKKVGETEYGVQYNVHKKQLDDATQSGGLFLGPPGYRFIKFPSTYITYDLDDRTCVSKDGLRVQFSVTFQYRMTEANMLPAIIKYREFEKWADIVEAAGLSAIHHSCSEYIISDFQSKRGQIQVRMEENLRLKLEGDTSQDLEGVYAMAVSLQLRNLELPREYNNAIGEKQSAEEDIALAINQRKQETTKAQTELLKATEEARKILDTATNEAEVLLTEAGLKAQETLFAFEKEALTVVEVKRALNLTTNGVLAYLTNTLLGEVQNLKISTAEPVKLSRSDEL